LAKIENSITRDMAIMPMANRRTHRQPVTRHANHAATQ